MRPHHRPDWGCLQVEGAHALVCLCCCFCIAPQAGPGHPLNSHPNGHPQNEEPPVPRKRLPAMVSSSILPKRGHRWVLRSSVMLWSPRCTGRAPYETSHFEGAVMANRGSFESGRATKFESPSAATLIRGSTLEGGIQRWIYLAQEAQLNWPLF